MRVNARFDAESQRQLEYLLEATGLGVSDVLKTSIARYFADVQAQRPTRLARMLAYSGTRGSGRSDVSVRAKELLTDTVSTKMAVRRSRPRTQS